jgi:hypothetical protein
MEWSIVVARSMYFISAHIYSIAHVRKAVPQRARF